MIRRSVSIHPLVDKFIRRNWAELVRKGYPANYNTTLQLAIISCILQRPPSEEELKKLLTSRGKLDEEELIKLVGGLI